jgi:hypothetical protein
MAGRTTFELAVVLSYHAAVMNVGPRVMVGQCRDLQPGNPMSENRLELTRDQQELLLQGLRFVRSSVALDMRDYVADHDAERRRQYERINKLEVLLKSAPLVEAASA